MIYFLIDISAGLPALSARQQPPIPIRICSDPFGVIARKVPQRLDVTNVGVGRACDERNLTLHRHLRNADHGSVVDSKYRKKSDSALIINVVLAPSAR